VGKPSGLPPNVNIIFKMNKCNTNSFIEKAKKIHGDLYDYSLVDYKKAIEKVKIICKFHGIFTQIPNAHISSKQGCPECSTKKASKSNKERRFVTLIEEMKKVHENKYDYSLLIPELYDGMDSKIPIICSKHGVFYQKPKKHLAMKNGCKKCSSESYYIKDFIERANKIHHRYNYSYEKTIYRGMNEKIAVTCPIHGDFEILARYFIDKKRGCKKCSLKDNNKSKKEMDWLDSLKIPDKDRNVLINFGDRYYNIDGVDYENKIFYEFYGDFFHGNLKIYPRDFVNPLLNETYGSLYDKTMKREKFILEKSDYKLVSIWESDFDLKNK
jgi:hypothetical protein